MVTTWVYEIGDSVILDNDRYSLLIKSSVLKIGKEYKITNKDTFMGRAIYQLNNINWWLLGNNLLPNDDKTSVWFEKVVLRRCGDV